MKTYQNVTADHQMVKSGLFASSSRRILQFVFLFSFVVASSAALAQLGVYGFTGSGACPHQNPSITSQPANAVFSNFSIVNTTCNSSTNDFESKDWNENGTIDLNEYAQFGITADPNYVLNLTSLTFTHSVDKNGSGSGTGNTAWILRSSINNYTANIATGSANDNTQSPNVILPAGSFTSINTVTFRLYLVNAKEDKTLWTIDDVTLNGSVLAAPADPGNPTSDSPQCSNPGVTLTANGTPPAGETWYWQTSATGTSTVNSGSTYSVITSGNYYIRSQDNTTLAWSSGAGSITVTVTPDVSTPVFSLGASSSRCQGAGTVTYTATAANSTSINYSLDAASLAAGNSINASTGTVTYIAGWIGVTTVTASGVGCNGPATAIHTVTVNGIVTTPIFSAGAASTRCQGIGTVTYTASAINTTGITYSLDAVSIAGGNAINSSTGAVSYLAGWSGTSIISASAAGCTGPQTSTHTVTITPSVAAPVFASGANSIRCLGAATVNYTATATNASGITYSLDALSLLGGNTINSSTGDVTYAALWVGGSVITATATGCNGPRTATHTVTVNSAVGTPIFTLGVSSTRCQGAGTVTYTANAANTSGITYSLDAASIAGGITINSSTGAVSYTAGWSGATTITASAAGCNGPASSTHTVTITPTVGTPIFSSGATSTRCQGAGTVTYTASASDATGITYSLNAAALAGGNSINSSTGVVTYAAGWTGATIITASAAGCSGPSTAAHTVTITPTVGLPIFTLGASSSRCQGAGTVTYPASATNNTGITYSLDAASIAGGNSINSSTADVAYVVGWSGVTIITASAAGCNGPRTSTHTVTVNSAVGTPVFTLGASSTRCQANGNVNYNATATNNTGITYSIDAASIAGGNTINSSNGQLNYTAGWSGTSIITATATGCNGPASSTHTVTITPTVGTPIFSSGATSTRCQGASLVNYTATASNATGITYSLNAPALAGGNSINSSTGVVTYAAGWTGATIITASATGCSGPLTATHTVTITPTVGLPIFTLGASSSRCQGAGTITYTASATNNTGITYSIDAASIAGGNSINSSAATVTYAAGWSGVTTITASAAGCSGPRTSTHTVTTSATVGIPVFTLGASSTRCQGAGLVNYSATATASTGIIYSLDAASIAGGNTINAATGNVTYPAGWSGTTTITANAAGCNGPAISSHIVTITPTVSTPIFSSGATSTRCQGAGIVTYTASATNTTGITYSLNAASITGGNGINSSTGAVTYVSGWIGTSIITASAAGCNGPRTSTHTVTITASVGTPVFSMGPVSSRLAAAGTVTYTATATATTGITYGLDAASTAAGNTINTSTGAVTYLATWFGTSTITASAAGCNGPATSTHVVTVNSLSVTKQLYLSDPAQALDRVDPVNTADATTASSAILSTVGTTTTTFTMAPNLCNSLTIKAGTITVRNYVTISSGAMPANPNITAELRYGATTIITLTNPTYAAGLLTWTAALGADVTVPAGQAIALRITTAQAGVNFRIDFDSQTKPSRIDLPVSTFINVNTLDVYSAAWPAGIPVTTAVGGTTKYIRATVTDPFGFGDITGMNIQVTPTGSTVAATSVATSGCTRTYEYAWTTPVIGGNYGIAATAREGFENTVTNTKDINFNICITCAPVAVNDSASGAGGVPIVVDVLANDNDPNNNINPASLAISIGPKNGSAYISNNTIAYLPNGTFQGRDTLTYQVCDLTSPTPLCATAQVFFTIDALIIDICNDASKSHTYYIPYPEQESYVALLASSNLAMPSNNIRTVISIKVPYPGMTVVWDEWEDGYEANIMNPIQATTKVWGDGNPFNGIAPGYASDIIPPGASIVLDNTMNANPRNPASIFYDGKDKVVSSGQIAVTQVSGEPTRMPVQAIKTNVTSTFDFGQSFTIPLGQDFNSQDFRYTALFIRASENNTTVNIDKDNNGVFETTVTLNEGGSYFINGGVLTGATVASDKPIGVELNAGGVDQYSIRNAPIFPASWYSNTYYTPVPTSDIAGNNPKDSSVVMLYNSLNRSLDINWYSGAPASGVITIPAKSAIRFPLAYSATATYKFVNLTGESFTAIEIVDSYTPGGGGNVGNEYDWSFNLISEPRLTDFATVAWAPGSLDGSRNDNPIWVTPSVNTTVYVKYDGVVTSGASTSPCGLKYDIAIPVNALNYIKIKDLSDNSQSGTAVYTCNGAKIAAVYGEDPATAVVANPSWDVGATIQPFCKQKIVIASDDYATTLVNQPVTISVLNNDFAFLGTVDPSTVTTTGLLQPKHGTTNVNNEGSVLFIPDAGYSGLDTFEYRVCSTPSPVVCDVALVVINISTCPSNGNQNIISGQVFIDRNKDALNNDGGTGLSPVKVYLYTDGNCNGTINSNELTDSVTVDSSGFYQFTKYPEKTIEDNFDNGSGGRTCANGTDGDSPWATNWVDANDPSIGFCNASQTLANTDVEITMDGAFGYALRLKGNNVSATRTVNINGATKAFLTFSYRRKSTMLTSGEDILVQASNGAGFTTIYTIAGNGATDANYLTIYNQDITSYASATTAIRFLTNNSVDDGDTIYVDNVSVKYLKYPQCYITSIDLSTLPASYSLTTVGQNTITINSGGSCSSQFDFGFGKPNVTVSGTLVNDKNGVVDTLVNGPQVGAPDGAIVYAYLADISGDVAYKTVVNTVTGTYIFPMAEVNDNYKLVVSANNVALGAIAPANPGFSAAWVAVGDAYGINNASGTGIETGTSDVAVAVKTGLSNVSNVNFGIQRLPNSDNYAISVNMPVVDQVITLNGLGMNPPVLSGSDPEDCSTGCNLSSKSVVIDTVPVNSEMYYQGALVTNGQLINNFDPNALQLKITAAAMGDVSVSFKYSYVDEAIMKDASPATYSLVWLVPLPVVGLTATASLNENDYNTTIRWSTRSEQNTSYFVVERSIDNANFKSTGNKVPAAGSSESRRDYQEKDNIRDLLQNEVIYYRVKLVDIDGKTTYSNVTAVRISKKPGVTIWPNPFHSDFSVSITTEKETTIDINLIDVNGRIIRTSTQKVAKGISRITMRNLDQLPAGMYLVEITDKKAGTTFQKLIKNNK